jgi:anhydro-N-acetylmuramic acid kinase
MAPAKTTTQEICELNFLVACEFARAVEDLLRDEGLSAGRIAAVASHGQTVCHLPPKAFANRSPWKQELKTGSTLQLGSVSALAALTGILTIGDFRAADMAVGGQGAPLVPWADAALFSDPRVARCVQNIGGIANVTFLPPAGGTVLAFDTGPGNMIIDELVRHATVGEQFFDRDGLIAVRGALCEALFDQLRRHRYFSRRPPKSTGREEFGVTFARKVLADGRSRKAPPADLIHTLTRLTAWSIADAYARHLPQLPAEVILCGGGADNPELVRMLSEELARVGGGGTVPRLRRVDEFGIPNKAKEAASFALLGAATLDGVAGNLPAVTGASRPVVLGSVAQAGGAVPPT